MFGSHKGGMVAFQIEQIQEQSHVKFPILFTSAMEFVLEESQNSHYKSQVSLLLPAYL